MTSSFKVLTFGVVNELTNNFVNETMLRNGIYNTSVPVLHANDLTISKMKKDWKYVLKAMGEKPKVINIILFNLDKCQLTEVDLILL